MEQASTGFIRKMTNGVEIRPYNDLGHYYVCVYTCNGRCGEWSEERRISTDSEVPEENKCCETNRFLLVAEDQNIDFHFNKLIYFKLVNSVDKPFDNYIGVYAKYLGDVEKK